MNIYWPIYLNIESEINKLMYAIHMDDSHLNVHSSIISDLILRCCAEIESLAKELYKNNGGTKKSGIKYDYDALKFLDDNWMISKKKVLISSINCFFSKVELTPFAKDTPKTDSPGKLTYMWNNAYQNLKHDRRNGLQHGNVEALFEAAAALYILNIYFKDKGFELQDDFSGDSLDLSEGSSIFSIECNNGTIYDSTRQFNKATGFDECVYTTVPIPDTIEEYYSWLDKVVAFRDAYIKEKENANRDKIRIMTPEQKEAFDGELAFQATLNIPDDIDMPMHRAMLKIRYRAVLNKNQF